MKLPSKAEQERGARCRQPFAAALTASSSLYVGDEASAVASAGHRHLLQPRIG